MNGLRERIIEVAKANGADIIGFAPAERFSREDEIFKILPETKTVIGMAFRVLRGIYRGVEEGTTYYQYTTMGVENMEETIMPMAQIKVAMLIESAGKIALPQRKAHRLKLHNALFTVHLYTDLISKSSILNDHGSRLRNGVLNFFLRAPFSSKCT